ncbi:MAG: DUF4162 domain-containing protein, partial [Desulfuromonas sp.]
QVDGVGSVALFGRGLHVVVEDGEAMAPKLREFLSKQGYAVERVEKIVPSMEDLFVSLIETRDRADQPQQEVQG